MIVSSDRPIYKRTGYHPRSPSPSSSAGYSLKLGLKAQPLKLRCSPKPSGQFEICESELTHSVALSVPSSMSYENEKRPLIGQYTGCL